MAQVRTRGVSVECIMRSSDFRHGVADVRNDVKPRFDHFSSDWLYDWGRQFAVLAPRDMAIVIEKQLNPEAVKFFERHAGDIL